MSELQLLVAVDEELEVKVAPEEEDQITEEGLGERLAKVVRRKVVQSSADLTKLGDELDRLQENIKQLLEGRTDRAVAGMGLNEIQVALGINAEGSIGVVTAGLEASITLVYSRT